MAKDVPRTKQEGETGREGPPSHKRYLPSEPARPAKAYPVNKVVIIKPETESERGRTP